MNTGNKVAVKGTLTEVLPIFSEKFGMVSGSKGLYSKSAQIGGIINVPPQSVVVWFRNGTTPTGERRAKLLLLMSLCGYEVTERSSLNRFVVELSDTIATVTGAEGASLSLGIKTKNILAWLYGQTKPKDFSSVNSFNDEFSERRNATIRSWKQNLINLGFIKTLDDPPPSLLSQVPVREEKKCEPPVVDTTKTDEVTILLLKALLANLDPALLSDEERKKSIRQAVGHQGLANITGNLMKVSMAPFKL